MSNMFRVETLRHTHPDAFAALPEPYQEDDCVVFYQDVNGNLCCEPDEDQTAVLGQWTSVYDHISGDWKLIT